MNQVKKKKEVYCKPVTIYQLRSQECPYYKKGYMLAKTLGFNFKQDYKKVCSFKRRGGYNLDDCLLEFTNNMPEKFEGRPLSFSDIIDLNGLKYYISPGGFQVLSNADLGITDNFDDDDMDE